MTEASIDAPRNLPVAVVQTAKERSRWSTRRVDAAMATFVALIPVTAAVPLGSHRPIFWMAWTAVIAALLLVRQQTRAGARFQSRLIPLSILSLIFLTAIAAQLLPFASTLGLARPTIAVDPGATLLALLRWASYAAFFWLAVDISQNRIHARRMAWTIFAGITANAIWALVAFRFLGDAALWGPKEHYQGSVTGTFINRNAYAAFLGFGLILGLGLLLNSALRPDRDRRRMAVILSPGTIWTATLWLALLIIAMALFGTASRFGILASLLGALLVVAGLALKHSGGSGRFSAQVIAWWSVLMIGLFALVGRPALERAIFTAADGQDRINLYIQTLDLIRQNAFFGVGLDGFELAFQSVHRAPLPPDLFWDRAHSTYLALWAEMGVFVGSLPPLIVALIAIAILRRVISARRDFALGLVALGAVVLGGLHSSIDFSLEIAANVYVFLALLALGFSSGKSSTGDRT